MTEFLIPETTRVCKSCGINKPIENFGRTAKGASKRRRKCVACESAAAKELRQKDRTKSRENNNRYYHKIKVTAEFKAKRREKAREYRAKPHVRKRLNSYRQRNLEKRRHSEKKSQLKIKYGVTIEWFRDKLLAQDHKCPICKCDITEREEKMTRRTARVDHDHATGGARGLLCGPCNIGLGQLSDSIDRLKSAISYLERYEK